MGWLFFRPSLTESGAPSHTARRLSAGPGEGLQRTNKVFGVPTTLQLHQSQTSRLTTSNPRRLILSPGIIFFALLLLRRILIGSDVQEKAFYPPRPSVRSKGAVHTDTDTDTGPPA